LIGLKPTVHGDDRPCVDELGALVTQDDRRLAMSIMVRTIVAILSIGALSSCTGAIEVQIFNATESPITVVYGSAIVTVPPWGSEKEVVSGSLRTVTIMQQGQIWHYQAPLGSLPGAYYRPGLRHRVKVQFNADATLLLLMPRDDFPYEGDDRLRRLPTLVENE
jgi:hypothetical protein